MHSFKNHFGESSDHAYIKDVLGGSLGNRADTVNHYHKTEEKWKRGLKCLKKNNKMLFSMSKHSGSRRGLKKINKIKAKSSRKSSYSISYRSRSDSYSYLSSDSELYEIRKPNELNYINKLYHIVTNNLKKKDQHYVSIEYEPHFDSKFSLSSGTKDPPLVVTVRLLGGNKQRATIISGLTCLWDSEDIDIMINE